MISVVQRVTRAEVSVSGDTIGRIGPGLLALVAIEKGDTGTIAERLAERLLNYRIFSDGAGRMNLSLKQTGGGILLVSQFTLAADTGKGLRPSFTPAADPESARDIFESMLKYLSAQHAEVATGRFGADMQISLVNDGPVTFILRDTHTSANI